MEIICNNEEEKAVLGCVILEPTLLDEVVTRIAPEHFYDLRNRGIYELLIQMTDEQLPIDVMSIRGEAIQKLGNVEKIGGIAYLADLANHVPSAAHLPYALEQLESKARLRMFQDAARQILQVLDEQGGDDGAKLEQCGNTLTALLQEHRGGEVSIKDLARQTLEQIQKAYDHEGECTGIATGFSPLDRLTTGLHGGEYILLAARPSMGKTALAMCIAENVAINQSTEVGVLSLEMKGTALLTRTYSSMAGINGRSLRSGDLNRGELTRLTNAFGKVATSGLHIDDSSGISVTEAAARIRRFVHKHKCKLVVIDYIQLIHGSADNRVQEVAQVSSIIKSLAISLDVPIICLSQLSRSNEAQGRCPRLSDLRDSGSLEQDADQVWFLYREDPESNLTQLNIAKNRNGPCCEIDLEFEPQYTRYSLPKVVENPFSRPKHPALELVND